MKWLDDLLARIRSAPLRKFLRKNAANEVSTTPAAATVPGPAARAASTDDAAVPLWKNRWVIAASIAGAFVFVSYPDLVRDRFEAIVTNIFPATDEGIILLETPQIFTRGRLVNDRATEHAWLSSQLKRTDELLRDKAFAAPDFIRFARKNFQLALTSPSPAEPAKDHVNGNGTGKDEVRERLAKLGLVAPPLDQLEDAIRYRDTIRNALLSTALDDRHDIDGNTVYRLNFNVALVPPRGSSRLAAVIAELSEIQDEKRRRETYVEVMHDWRDKVELDLLRNTSDRNNTILYAGAELSPEEHSNFELAMFTDSVDQVARYLLAEGHGELPQADKAALDKFIKEHGEAIKGTAISGRAAFREASREFQRKYLLVTLDAVPPLKEHMKKLKFLDGRLDWMLERCNPNTLIPLGPLELTPEFQRTVEKKFGDQLRCPGRVSVLIPDIDVLDTLVLLNDGSIAIPDDCRDMTRLEGILASVAGRPFDTSCVKVADAVSRVQRTNQKERRSDRVSWITARVMADTVAKTTLPGGSAVKLGSFFEMVPPSLCNPGFCRPAVRIRDLNKAVSALTEALKNRTSVFTYAVTPNRSIQRHEMNTRSSGELSANGKGTLSALFGRISEDSEGYGIGRDPMVIGFGDWDRVQSDPNRTKFGWVMFPKPALGSYFLKRQSAENYSVSALVSVPGWWKLLRVQVRTCWISETNLLKTSDTKKVCPQNGTRESYEFETRLPGDASELMQNLRFRVITYPYVDQDPHQPPQEVEVGRSANIVIRGGRLWRSPIVRLGNQEAEEVEVLPDMRGIIARFKCIHPSPGTAGLVEAGQTEGPPVYGELQVFTSEGKTIAIPIRRNKFKERFNHGEQPCGLT